MSDGGYDGDGCIDLLIDWKIIEKRFGTIYGTVNKKRGLMDSDPVLLYLFMNVSSFR